MSPEARLNRNRFFRYLQHEKKSSLLICIVHLLCAPVLVLKNTMYFFFFVELILFFKADQIDNNRRLAKKTPVVARLIKRRPVNDNDEKKYTVCKYSGRYFRFNIISQLSTKRVFYDLVKTLKIIVFYMVWFSNRGNFQIFYLAFVCSCAIIPCNDNLK